MQEEVKALYSSVRRFNATCFIVFSAVLPRGCEWQLTQELYLAFNRFLQNFARGKHCGFMPTFTSFIYKDGPRKEGPIESLFAVRDGGLHVNLLGAMFLQTVSRWHCRPSNCTTWLLRLVSISGMGKGCGKWVDGGGLQKFTLGREWHESSEAPTPWKFAIVALAVIPASLLHTGLLNSHPPFPFLI